MISGEEFILNPSNLNSVKLGTSSCLEADSLAGALMVDRVSKTSDKGMSQKNMKYKKKRAKDFF